MPANVPQSKFLPLAAGLAGGYLQNRLTYQIAGRLSRRGGFVRRTLVSILVSWAVGKLLRWGQQQLSQPRTTAR